ncbi:MAG: tRNA threonylcarbamoyladenosine dehydratase [Faecalicoccus sp.]|nr:tRNA threonylcarbamoyladenosine dehydratase [Faecalicoccus sp.]
MENRFERTELLLGKDAMDILEKSHIAIFGIGGVGGYVCEALARSGVGHFDLIDNDTVSITNINRQIIALDSTVGKAKTEVMKERILQINPNAVVEIHNCFYLPDTRDKFDFTKYDYVVDAVDTVTAKLDIIMACDQYHIPIISAMGAGNKLNPADMEVADIYQTSMCPLAKVMRRELKKRGIKRLKVVYSKEKPLVPASNGEKKGNAPVPGSVSFVPSVTGLIMASEVIKDLIL